MLTTVAPSLTELVPLAFLESIELVVLEEDSEALIEAVSRLVCPAFIRIDELMGCIPTLRHFWFL